MGPDFAALYAGLDLAGPGSAADSRRALAIAGTAGPVRVLELGCGPGPASLVLLEALPEARVTGVDLDPRFVEAAERRVASAGHGARFAAVAADMGTLPFADASFDLLWSEGAAYFLGVPEALRRWRRLLAPGGRLAFSEAVWLTPQPAAPARALFAGYPAMTDVAGVRDWIAAAGWRRLGDFVISDAAWENYYGPLGARAAALEADGGPTDATRAVREEIEVRRTHGTDYGYAFFVAAP
jgi:SAM-dependent methyltransferase